uniref:Uncharacterized protein n=1 Tax=Heterorhabditis bacteriophora TaxID=37862 RepID=A0A1I7XK34_HETBA
MSINSFITNSENLDEKLSVVEFIKTLKKIDSVEAVNGNNERTSGSSSSIGSMEKMSGKSSEDATAKQKKPMEKNHLKGNNQYQ